MSRGDRPIRVVDVAWLLVGVAGLAASITILFMGMRAVLDIGGSCAEGGPYVVATPCPEGVAALFPLGLFGWFLFAGIIGWKGDRAGGFSGLAFLAWPALFIALGWNFLEYGFFPLEGEGPEMGFVIPGIVFWLMGGVPLAIGIWGAWTSRRVAQPETAADAKARRLLREAASSRFVSADPGPPPPGLRPKPKPPAPTLADARAGVAMAFGEALSVRTSGAVPPQPAAGPVGSAAAEPSLVDELERLAELRRRGDLSMLEYDAAKRALIHEHEAGG